MSNTQSIGDLDFNKLWTTNAEKDRETSLQIGVYRGRASMAIFSGKGGAPKLKLTLPRQHNIIFREIFDVIRKSGPDQKHTCTFLDWDPVVKKMKPIATCTFGSDASNQPYIGITAEGMEPTKFPIRTDLKFDISQIPDINPSKIAINSFLAAMDNCVNAMNLSNFKFDPSRAGGSSGRSGSYSGPRQSPAGGSPSGIEDDIPF